tara:strand:- start:35 stop:289 length:255 start_codon:yes stop_codon:yes gene_type:complete
MKMPQKPETRNYKKEYERDHSSREAKIHRNMRNNARRRAIREGLVTKGDGKEVDHKTPLSKGGSNGRNNQRVVSRKTNRKKGTK